MRVRIKDSIWEQIQSRRVSDLPYGVGVKRTILYRREWFPSQVIDCFEDGPDVEYVTYLSIDSDDPLGRGHRVVYVAKSHVDFCWFEPVILPAELFKI